RKKHRSSKRCSRLWQVACAFRSSRNAIANELSSKRSDRTFHGPLKQSTKVIDSDLPSPMMIANRSRYFRSIRCLTCDCSRPSYNSDMTQTLAVKCLDLADQRLSRLPCRHRGPRDLRTSVIRPPIQH